MRKHFYVICSLLLCSSFLSANPGDTTFAQAHNNVQLDYYNNFDAPVTFPSTAIGYRKVIMTFTLGKYQCPAGSQYCGDWDYTVTTYLQTATDTVELGRLITPYANATYPRTGWNWKQRYNFDVTDLYPLLKDNATIRIFYSGYSGGFTADVKFAFIEGTPPRNVVGIKHLWNASYNYGDPLDPIDTHVLPYNLTAPTGTQNAEMRFTVTGHGSDNLGCSEFCSRYYQVKQNGTTTEQRNIWKADCGSNNLYPQSGTWIYNRANWCPGEQVAPAAHKLTGIVAGTNFTADVDFQAYTRSGTGTPSYSVGGIMIYYAGFNKTLDASVEDIISPSNNENNFRVNPICGKPVIKIKNTGATTISTVSFEYGVVGTTLQTYTLTGISLASLDEMNVSLPILAPLTNMPASSTSEFVVTIQQVNGVADSYAINNTMKSSFVTALDWPNQFNVVLKTNTSSPYYLETSWRIEDLNGTIIAQRNPAAANTQYNDAITSLANGCYKFIVTDAGCNGAYWWANSSTTGTGWVYAIRTDGTYLPLSNGLPAFPSSVSQDFGCGYTSYFRVGALLPLELLTFSGKGDKNVNHLYWETAQEVNTHHFDVEFSTDGADFTKVIEVAAKGNSSLKTLYQTPHIPVRTANVYYYRLKMVDVDGSYKYSNVITIRPSLKAFVVSTVVPNPFVDQLKFTVTSTKSTPAVISLYDALGRLHYRSGKNLETGINTITIANLGKISAGAYLLEVDAEGDKSVQKIIKN
jgi:hypothetical protein